MKKVILAILCMFCTFSLSAQQSIIKFATIAPDGSTWMNVMKEYDRAVRTESGGRVGFKIYSGGVAGDELNVLQKMRLGQYHCAGFTGVGMGKIAPPVRILDAPFLFKTSSEVDYILDTYDAEFRKAFEDNGFVLLGWAEVGKIFVFTNKPVSKVRDMDGVKMWTWEGDPVAEYTFKALDINPIPLSITDVLTSLQTGLIDGVYTSPLAAVSLQWFTAVKYMLELPLTNAMGAVLIAKREYDKMPQDVQEILLRNGKQFMRKLTTLSRQDNEKSLQTLKKNKIVFTHPASQEELATYDDMGKNARRLMAGKLFSMDLMQRIEGSLAEYRQSHKSPK